jgi:hypothetical protein
VRPFLDQDRSYLNYGVDAVARINVDDKLFRDKRYERLLLITGDGRIAKGAVLEAFMLAQEYFQNSDTEGLIPFDAWESNDMHEGLIKSGCATVQEKGIYVMGSRSQFTWIAQKAEAGASASDKKLTALSENRKKRWSKGEKDQNGTERNRTDQNGIYQNTDGLLKTQTEQNDQNGSEPLTLSLSPTQKEKEKEKKSSDVSVAVSKTFLIEDAPNDPMSLSPDEISMCLSGVLSKLEPPHDKSPREGPKNLTLAKLDGKKAATQATA